MQLRLVSSLLLVGPCFALACGEPASPSDDAVTSDTARDPEGAAGEGNSPAVTSTNASNDKPGSAVPPANQPPNPASTLPSSGPTTPGPSAEPNTGAGGNGGEAAEQPTGTGGMRPLDEPVTAGAGGEPEPADGAGGATDEEPAEPEPTEPEPAEPEPVEPEPTEVDDSDCVIPNVPSGPVGYGAQTTGGGNAQAVSVASFAEAEAALDSYRDDFKDGVRSSLVLRYTGNFDYGSITDVCVQHTLDGQILQIKEMENVTFEGAPGSAANFGIKINRAKNVIVRNMTMGLLPGGGDSDAITIEGNGTNGDVENVWIDHNDLFSSTKDDCDGAGDTEFDGLIDIKKGARYITISYNYLHDHQKTGLLGHSDTDDMDRYVTFHHNWYQNVVSRTPLHRFGYVHLFNNYFTEIASSGINVRMGGVALIEANFFEHAANPVTSRYSDEVGFWDLRDNYVGAGITWTTESDTLANAEDWESTATFPSSELNYAYTPDEARCVKKIVMAQAGAKL